MYKRTTLNKGKTQKKQKNEHNRVRDIIVNFRMSKAERESLDNRIKLSGMVKQDYMIKSSLYQQICVVGNKRVFEEMEKQLKEIYTVIVNSENLQNVDQVKLESLRTIAEIIAGFN